MATSAPSNHVGPVVREDLYKHRLAALKGMKHFITYDRFSVHKPPQTPSTSAALRTSTTRASRIGSPPYDAQHIQRGTDVPYPDLPPLQEEEEEDFEDNRSLSRYSAETNKWLFFAGIFALIITLFIVNFSTLPHQAHVRRRAQEVLSQLSNLSQQLEAAPFLDDAATSLSNLFKELNISQYTDPLPPPTLAMEIRDEWAPALWYTSLMITLLGTILILTIKHWLMSCTFATWALSDVDYEEDENEDKERSDSASELEKDWQKEWQELQRAHARMRKHKETMRKTRKETLRKTEKVKPVVPVLMYSAMGMFVCGVMVKLGSLMWIGHA